MSYQRLERNKMNINTGRDHAISNIATVEAKYKANWVGQMPLRLQEGQEGQEGSWSESPADVYWQETPPVDGYSNYFAIIHRGGKVYITCGASAVVGTFYAVVANDGEVIYSRCRHDYRESSDGSVFIDGGRDYCRTSITKAIQLKIVDGQWIKV